MRDVIYEDNHIIVCEKKANVLSMADNTKDEDMLSLVKSYIKDKYNKPGNVFLGLVHRLDRPVGGVMVFAKTSKAASRLSDEIRKKQLKKTYLCIVHGHLKNKSGTLKNYLYKDNKRVMSFVVNKNHKGAKACELEYEVIKEIENFSLLKINLVTGRHHQIRVQLSNINHPIVGDQKYSVGEKKVQIALFANELSFNHPTKKEMVTFKCYPNYTRFPWSLFK